MTDDERLTYLRGLLRQLTNMLSEDAWEDDDVPPTFAALREFFWFLHKSAVPRRPGLGAGGDGGIIATWHGSFGRIEVSLDAAGALAWRRYHDGEITEGTALNAHRAIRLMLDDTGVRTND